MPRSVRTRLTIGVTVLVALALGAGAVWFVHSVENNLVGRIRSADAAALVAVRDQVQRDGRVPRELRDVPGRPNTGLQVIGPDGNVVAASPNVQGQEPYSGWRDLDRDGDGRRSPRPLPPPTQAPSGATPADNVALTGLTVSTPDGPVSLVAASSLDGVRDSVSELTRMLWLAVPFLVALIGFGTWLVTGRALRPVEAITRQVEDITATNLHERVPVPSSRDEVAHLASTMNDMLERLDGAAARQRQFVSDASHELRSPIASIRTELEVALLHPEVTDWDLVARNALAEDIRLEALVADLLTLARTDEVRDPGRLQPVDLAALARDDASRSRRVPVVVHEPDGPGSAVVTGRADELGRVLAHLLDNAARHAQSQVDVALGAGERFGHPGRIVCTVDDDGPGVPVEDRERIFERFGRLDEGRQRDVGGAGLGLAVVRALVERHGGTVTCDEHPGGPGARFTVTLPAAAPTQE